MLKVNEPFTAIRMVTIMYGAMCYQTDYINVCLNYKHLKHKAAHQHACIYVV
jgi:hypothetical protein